MNDIVKHDPKSHAISAQQRAAELVAKYRQRKESEGLPQPTGGGQFAKFNGNTGQFTVGKDDTVIPESQKFIVAAEGVQHGFKKWEGGKVVEERMANFLDGNVRKPEGPMVGELPKPRDRDGWQEMVSIDLTGYQGEFDGIYMKLQGSSKGLTNCIWELVARIADQIESKGGAAGFVNPIVTFYDDPYEHKTYQRTVHPPRARLHGWTDFEGNTVGPDGRIDGQGPEPVETETEDDDVLG